MISVHFLILFMVTNVLIFAEAFRGPHHPTVGHQHYHPQPSWQKKIVNDREILHDQRHIAEDLGQSEHFQEEKLSDAELSFRYFKVHDTDNNSNLDGIEMYHAIKHHLDMLSTEKTDEEDWPEKERRIVNLIDKALEEYDTNNDGYISYHEFIAGSYTDELRKDEM